ncbi:MAG TPA: Ig-like domain-containing protein [Gemmatimonadales bacterium]|nr:Ig-like domain-containing protein [Gemmatimonadales bacterium]
MSRTTCQTMGFVSAVLLLWIPGCTADSLDPQSGLGPQIGTSSITVAPSSATIAQGGTVQLTARIVDEFGDPLQHGSVTWSTSNSDVATVSVGGTVYGHGAGRAAITASTDGKIQSSAVRVLEGEPQSKPR